jgi:hypothetical protein
MHYLELRSTRLWMDREEKRRRLLKEEGGKKQENKRAVVCSEIYCIWT